LRAVPGLTLVELETADTTAAVPGEFRLTAFGNAPQPRKVVLGLSEGAGNMPGASGAAGAGNVRFVTQRIVDVVPTCSSAPPNSAERVSCNDPVSVAADMVDMLRTRIFPPDPSLKQYLQARLADARLDPNQRLKALMDLTAGRGPRGPDSAPKLDDGTVRGAIELALRSADPQMRAQVWEAMRGVRDADLLQPLMSAARDDADAEVRLQAVVTLAASFPEDERARAALQSIAREDTRPLIRALAQRGLNGEAAWKDYMVASLKDGNRPIAERMEAFMYHMYQPSAGGGFMMSINSGKILDEEVIQALGKALPQATGLSDVKRMAGQLMGDLAQVKTPAADGLLAELLESGSDAAVRRAIVTQLARRSSESRVRSMLEKVRSGDADPQLRELAEQALSGKPLSGAGPGMMQLPPLMPR
jgi:HEAT repeat protein